MILNSKTGHTENWTLDDHLFFLKMRKKCKSIPTLVTTIQKKCPDLTAETIVNHEAWYKHYEDLRGKQKMAVREWRQQKELERKINIDEIGQEIERCHEKEDLENEIPEEKTKIKVFKKGKSSHSETNNNSMNKNEKKELIKKWKIEKENKRFMDEEQMKMQMKLRKEREENKRKKRQEKIQESLEEYKRKKSRENTLKETNEIYKEKCKYNATLIRAFR